MKDLISVQEVVQELNIIDDTLFQKMAEDPEFCGEMISTILGEKVIVKKVTPQNSVRNLQGRTVVLDALCVTANITEPGTKFKEVPNVCAIYITKFDIFQGGKTVYHIDRVVRETGQILDNGLQEIYVNTKIHDGTEVTELMHIFTVKDAYDFEKFPKVSKRKKQFKESEGGQGEVCELVENYAKQYAEKAAEEAAKEAAKGAARDNARRLFENGASYEIVKKSIPLLSNEELQKIFDESEVEKN